ncbi:MAG: TolC family protein [Gemmatimonadaceae bacterium]|nr:TolC family protein [Gemmatimonadaceae bacterium]MCC6433141.1 TolC family protein [Gemmatimonadaceae bacterium]
MRSRRAGLFGLAVGLWATALPAQSSMTFAQFATQVEANHPAAVQAALVRAQARAALQEAWGAFDPKLSFALSQKAYKGEPYYTYLDAALKVPTPLGADLKLGFERTAGTKASDDRSTPKQGLLSLGMTVPLGQRLITDERRTALTIARAQRDIGDAEQRGLVNKLLLDAAKAYGNWYAADRRRTIATDGVRLARFRFDAVAQRVRNGESAPIDTLEASLEVQRRSVTLAEADVEVLAARLIAESFLWDARGVPVSLPDDAVPSMVGLEQTVTDTTRLSAWVAAMRERHPELQKADAKLTSASAERLLARQALLPDAEASVASIAERDQAGLLGASDRWRENYKAGLDVATSVLLLKERGKAARTDQKYEFARLDRDRLRRDLAYAVRIALNDIVLLERVLSAQRANVGIATQLRDAEQQRFINGESTLLIVNLRERLVLDEAGKLASLEGKLAAARAALVVAVGDPSVVR